MGRSRKLRLRSPAAECINTEKYDNERERVEKKKGKKKGEKKGKKERKRKKEEKRKKREGKEEEGKRGNREGKYKRRYLIVRDSAAVLIRDMIDSNNNRGAAEARQGDATGGGGGGAGEGGRDRLCSHLAVIEPDQFSITFALVNNRFVVHFGGDRRTTREIQRADARCPDFFLLFSPFPFFSFFLSLPPPPLLLTSTKERGVHFMNVLTSHLPS